MSKQKHKISLEDNEKLAGGSDHIEELGPGQMLKDARIMCGLSQQQVAEKLNFRTSLVQDIEVDKLDNTLPEAFNRGYLKNYAKLVNVAQEDILNRYDQLGVEQRQCAGMQSFSKGTEKQAEHKMLMWITYLILGVLITATIVWWWQRPSVQPEPIAIEVGQLSVANGNNSAEPKGQDTVNMRKLNRTLNTAESLIKVVDNTVDENTAVLNSIQQRDAQIIFPKHDLANVQLDSNNEQTIKNNTLALPEANVAFTFSGDCWVNIYDASGERIAWGVKKSGYIMRISGQAPFSITLGKPELVEIDYNGVSVDMTAFNVGNIAKFSLPLVP